jgi:hypothetical protein
MRGLQPYPLRDISLPSCCTTWINGVGVIHVRPQNFDPPIRNTPTFSRRRERSLLKELTYLSLPLHSCVLQHRLITPQVVLGSAPFSSNIFTWSIFPRVTAYLNGVPFLQAITSSVCAPSLMRKPKSLSILRPFQIPSLLSPQTQPLGRILHRNRVASVLLWCRPVGMPLQTECSCGKHSLGAFWT